MLQGGRCPMSSVPIPPDSSPFLVEGILARIRDGQRAEDELIRHYLDPGSREGSALLAVLKTIYGGKAERVGTDVLSLIGTVLCERRQEIRTKPEILASPK